MAGLEGYRSRYDYIRWDHIDDITKCGKFFMNRKPNNRYSPGVIDKEQSKREMDEKLMCKYNLEGSKGRKYISRQQIIWCTR